MNDADVAKQIQQMVRFIRQEADEKANEISVSAEEEFNIEKLQLVEAEKKKIRQEYERKEKQVEVRKKIEYSMQLNASRIKVLQAQDDLVNKMKDDAMKELLLVSHNHHEYKNLLKDLIVQLYCSVAARKITIMWNQYCIQQSTSMHQKQMSMNQRYLLTMMCTYHLPQAIMMLTASFALEVLSWLLEMERLCLRVHLTPDWKLFSARNCQRSGSFFLARLQLN
uniref:V-type proton ATPase subunit E n=1 Tax=Zea mays TaxID=4577 RepID=A0A804NFU2_MAIZE